MTRWAVSILVGCCAATALASVDGLSDAPDGATCDYFNRGADGKWTIRGGAWRDASSMAQGDDAYGQASLSPKASDSEIAIDVTRLVSHWLTRTRDPAHGLFIRSMGPVHGTTDIASRESADASRRPVLVIVSQGGERRVIPAVADTYLDCTTEKGLGTQSRVKVGKGVGALLAFNLPRDLDPRQMTKASLHFTVQKQYGNSTLGVFAADPPASPDREPRLGLAAASRDDVGIGANPDVWFATGFEKQNWQSEWGEYDPRSEWAVVEKDADRKFVPLSGKALRVTLGKGKNLGLNLHYVLRNRLGADPDQAYFRYYLRFADDWSPNVDGGKLPGFAGTYGRAGWGMRKSTGDDGWSMRGSFVVQAGAGNPYQGRTGIGTYAYHLDADGPSGQHWPWPLGRLAALEKNRWYSVEQYFKVNTPGRSDGVLRAWIDGRLVFERVGIRVRNVDDVRIESVWFNVYHGGTTTSPRDMSLYIDNVVIAGKYIGPSHR